MARKVLQEQRECRPLAVDDHPVAIEEHGFGADHSGALNKVTIVSPYLRWST